MKRSEIKSGNSSCKHEWVKRDKKNIVILHRVCTQCGQEELHTEESMLDEAICKKLMRLD